MGASRPATLKYSIRASVTGDYAYAQLESLLAFVGRLEGVDHDVLQIEFFHSFAAWVRVEGKFLKCVSEGSADWKIVGFMEWVE
jgi:hypothetical protein